MTKSKGFRILICSVVILLCYNLSYAQSQVIDALKSQREAAEAEIKRIDKELAQLKSSSSDTKKRLQLSTQRLAKRKEILSSINKQIATLNSKAKTQSQTATNYQERLEGLKSTYRASIRELYRLDNLLKGSSLLVPDSIRYLHTHRAHMVRILLSNIKAQSQTIELTQGELGKEIRQITIRTQELELLQADEVEAIESIALEQKEIKALESKLNQQSKDLSAKKSIQLKELEELQQQILLAVEAEIRAQRDGNTKIDIKLLDTYSNSFKGAQGNLRSPLQGAKVVDTYGVHNHPTQAGIKIDNRGVNLKGTAGAQVRVVASGEVRKVFVVAGMGTSVLVRHGQYLTVYSNLKSISVKGGDIVIAGDSIGRLSEDGILHFEIWNEMKSVNPEEWVKF